MRITGLARLAAHFAPDEPPTFRGRRADATGLLELCASATDDDQEAGAIVLALVREPVLLRRFAEHTCTSEHSSCVAGTRCRALARTASWVAAAMKDGSVMPDALGTERGPEAAAVLLGACLDDETFERVHSTLVSSTGPEDLVQWWRDIMARATSVHTADSVTAHAAAVALRDDAHARGVSKRFGNRFRIAYNWLVLWLPLPCGLAATPLFANLTADHPDDGSRSILSFWQAVLALQALPAVLVIYRRIRTRRRTMPDLTPAGRPSTDDISRG